MSFDSVPFLLFLPAAYLVYWGLPHRSQNAFVLLASYLFYGWWDWRFLGLIALSSAIDYRASLGIASGRRRRLWLGASLVANLGLLFAFKYLDFGIESFAALLRSVGFEAHPQSLGLILPVGISFYTFQTLSYTIDVYRGRLEPTRDPIAFFAFVSFFPQLVAGPIERASHLLPQVLAPRRFCKADATDGVMQILYGLTLKIVVADRLAGTVAEAYADPHASSGWELLVGTYAFAFQIYGDFAGYSHVALGSARLFGFDLSRNFALPYFAVNPADFWRRWHISLSTWFRDYVYVPLGGNRRGELHRALAVIATFALSGLWHGAGWTFVVWGLFHGLLVAIPWWGTSERLEWPLGRRALPALRDALAVIATFHVVCIGWVFFRAASLGDALVVLERIVRSVALEAPSLSIFEPVAWTIAAVVAWEWLQRGRQHGLELPGASAGTRVAIALACVLAIALGGPIESVPFIYFQF
ncbi:MAG: MBOAT family protein [Myxococcota bacterium]|nr:MBOAT family protein [Myxococcota bacterium]